MITAKLCNRKPPKRTLGLVLGASLAFMSVLSEWSLGQDNSVSIELVEPAGELRWKISDATAEFVEVDERKSLRLVANGDSADGAVGLALPPSITFREGLIEIELKGKNVRQESFLGVAFNVIDEKRFEAVYFRPFNFKGDEVFRNRAVQYISWPDYTWSRLRKENPGRFEAAVNPVPDPDGWFRARIEVDAKRVQVFVNDNPNASLDIERLTEGNELRPIGLFVDVSDGLFSSFRIRSFK